MSIIDVEKFYDKNAYVIKNRYQPYTAIVLDRKNDIHFEKLFAFSELKNNVKVLDIGCGNGFLLNQVTNKFSNCSIHSTAVVDNNAKLDAGVEIGPYCIVGKNVRIGKNTKLKSHIFVDGDTVIGENNEIFPFASIGLVPQDLKFKGENSQLIIGNNNKIREHVTIHLGTKDGGNLTQLGNNCLLMVGVHIAHDCKVGNSVILANNATLAGHVEVGDDVVISNQHQHHHQLNTQTDMIHG